MFENSFIDGCLSGKTDIKELDAYVEYWHTHKTGNTLQSFLGMSQDEYIAWLRNGDAVIQDILSCRADGISFQNYATPVGRIDYLGANGQVGESIEYTDAKAFEKEIRECNDCGVPMKVVVYRDANGNTVPHKFVGTCDPPLHGFKIEPAPTKQAEEAKPQRRSVRERVAEANAELERRNNAKTPPAPQKTHNRENRGEPR